MIFYFQFSEGWGYFMLFHSHFSNFIHTVSIWLTLSLAIWRFIMIKEIHQIKACTEIQFYLFNTNVFLEFNIPGLLCRKKIISISDSAFHLYYSSISIKFLLVCWSGFFPIKQPKMHHSDKR